MPIKLKKTFGFAVRAPCSYFDDIFAVRVGGANIKTVLPTERIGLFKRIIVTDIDNPRALPAADLARRLGGVCDDIEVIESPLEAYDKALSYGDDIFVCGSLYLASEMRPYII